jgi:hypothetical protein
MIMIMIKLICIANKLKYSYFFAKKKLFFQPEILQKSLTTYT